MKTQYYIILYYIYYLILVISRHFPSVLTIYLQWLQIFCPSEQQIRSFNDIFLLFNK